MSLRLLAPLLLLPLAVLAQPAEEEVELTPEEQQANFREIFGFEEGPLEAKLGTEAQLKVPKGWLFTGKEGTERFLQATNNLSSGRELGMVFRDEDKSWVLFSFDPVGYVKDDEKDALDAEAMLESISEGTEQANEYFRERGLPTMTITGWMKAPYYDETSNNLEWAPKAVSSEGDEIVNYNTRLLGRRGVMSVSLIVDPEGLEAAMPGFRGIVGGFSFVKGEDYASFIQGDKVAEYGLAALVTGGAVAAAAKSGLLQKFWKFIVLGLAGLFAGVKKLFGAKSNESQS